MRRRARSQAVADLPIGARGGPRHQVLERVWRQFLDGVDRATRRALARARFAAHLDDEVDVGPAGVSNAARLMVHPPGSRERRPESVTGLGNLFLAADYVRTFTDLASMEGANEAGRRAARGVLRAAGLAAEGVRVFEFPAINRFRMMRALDQRLHQAGLAHCFDWGGAVLRAFMRGADEARPLPQRVVASRARWRGSERANAPAGVQAGRIGKGR